MIHVLSCLKEAVFWEMLRHNKLSTQTTPLNFRIRLLIIVEEFHKLSKKNFRGSLKRWIIPNSRKLGSFKIILIEIIAVTEIFQGLKLYLNKNIMKISGHSFQMGKTHNFQVLRKSILPSLISGRMTNFNLSQDFNLFQLSHKNIYP